MNRASLDEVLMGCAWLWSKRGTCDRLQVGAVIADSTGRIIQSGYNGAPAGAAHCAHGDVPAPDGCQLALHAESNTILWAGRAGMSVAGHQLYCTHSPCWDCSKQIVVAGIQVVIYAVEYRNRKGRDYLTTHGVNVIKYGFH